MLQDPLSKPRPPDHAAATAGGGGGAGGTVQASDRKHINGSDGLARNSGRTALQNGGGGGGAAGPAIIKCPRCDSMNTKFCYYNNYSLTQPRHFCKNCRRYWTQGGSLRNVPVGGGCRKNKRLSKASSILSSCTASMASPPPLPSSSSSACNFSANAARMMAMDPPGLLMDMNHLDMLTNLNAHHHHHRHHQHHHQGGGPANPFMSGSSPFHMPDVLINQSFADPPHHHLGHHQQQQHHNLLMNHHHHAGDGSHLLSMAFSRLQESLRLNGGGGVGGGGGNLLGSEEAEHGQCGQQLSLMTALNPNPNPNPNPSPNLNPNPNISNASMNMNMNMIPTPASITKSSNLAFEHDPRSPAHVFSHHHASMKSESAGNGSSVFSGGGVNGSSATGRLGSMEDQLAASFNNHGSHSTADNHGPLSPAMNLSSSNNAAHFDLEARLKFQQQRQLALHLGAGAGAGAGDGYHHHHHHNQHHQSFNIMQEDHHINNNNNNTSATASVNHNHNNSSSSNLPVFDDPSDRSETLNMLRRHIQHANTCSQDEDSNNVDSSNKLVLASHGDGDGYGGDHPHDAGMNSASDNHELATNHHHHYVGADHHQQQQQLISFWNHSNGGSINPTIWNK